jgi:tetratricopeptide (TPR) repeat protein
MAYQSEIEKLERRYQENPDQWFAALADQYRKSGSMELALQVVKAGLEKRPNYVSGHIVLGRCLLDQKDDAGASAAFRRVLELDGENIMALKTLAEIAQRTGDVDGERGWLSRLLEIDPMNDDAREAMNKLPALAVAEPPAGAAQVPAAPEGALAGFEATSFADIAPPEAEPPPTPEPAVAAAPEPVMSEPAPAPAEALELEQSGVEAAPTADVAPALEMPMLELQPAGTEITATADQGGLDVEVEEPVMIEETAATPPAMAGDSMELMPLDEAMVGGATSELTLTPMNVDAEGSSTELQSALPEPAPLVQAATQDETAALPGGSEPEPVVTETMAELYAKQGLLQQARAVYQQLIAARPGDAKLRRRLQELEPQAAGTARRRRPTAAATGGMSARAFIAGVLSGQGVSLPPAAGRQPQSSALDQAFANEPPGGAPTMPAADEVSLASVFPDDAAGAGPARQAEGGSGGGGAFSFDEFFGGGRRPARPSAPRPSTGGSPGGEDDFKSWLKDLKT